MKIAVLWATLTGYIGAGLKALADRPGTELFVADNVGPTKQAPFADNLFSWIATEKRFKHNGNPDPDALLRQLKTFDPDMLLVASWSTPAYNRACNYYRGKALRVCGMDNQWYGTPKQWLGVLTAPMFVQRLFDCVLVAGERQRVFAYKLGYDGDRVWYGLYCPDYAGFSAVRLPNDAERARRFLFAARLVYDKGLDLLVDAYQKYRRTVSDPWPLDVVGVGPLSYLLENQPGIAVHGFIQPDRLPSFLAKAGCFLLPSVHEHWGVAIQEATVAGLPVICSEECGASVHYVVDGYNGCVVRTGSAESLLQAMVKIATASPSDLLRMSVASITLSEQLTPKRWAEYIVQKATLAYRALKL
jgi:glycosyltransferase involved in cell wall biosynthesis